MTLSRPFLAIVVTGAALTLGVVATYAHFSPGKTPMNVDLTIFLAGSIATKGGVVLILPEEIPADQFVLPDDAINPANGRVTPAEPGDLALGAVVSAQKTVITFQYPAGAHYTYRFRTDDPGLNAQNILTDRIGVGSGTGVDPVTGETEAYDLVLTHHIDTGGGWTIAQSRAARAELNMGFLSDRYDCVEYAAVQVCDASQDHLEP